MKRMKIIIAEPYRHLECDIRALPRLLAEGKGEFVHNGRNQLIRFMFQGVPVMVKRFKRANPVQQIAYTFFRKTKAERAYLFAGEYRRRGIDTPHEVAYIEQREHGLFTTGYFVSLACPDPAVFPMLVPVEKYNRQLAGELSAEIARMHQAGILHGDLNFGNFLYHEEDGHFRFTVVDINRSAFTRKPLTDAVYLKNLSTMTTRVDLFRFMTDEYIRLLHPEEEARRIKARIMRYWEAEQKKQRRKHRFKQWFKGGCRAKKE